MALRTTAVDFPVSQEIDEWVYAATFRVEGTDARFVVTFPPEGPGQNLYQWGMFGTEITEADIAALEAFAELADSPPVMWWDEDGQEWDQAASTTVWAITEYDPEAVYSHGPDVYLLENSEGEFSLLEF